LQDADGFKKIYVPKDQILTEEQVYGARKQSFNGDKKKDGASNYFYRQKSPKGEKLGEGGDAKPEVVEEKKS
jgi:hypothetical protein